MQLQQLCNYITAVTAVTTVTAVIEVMQLQQLCMSSGGERVGESNAALLQQTHTLQRQ